MLTEITKKLSDYYGYQKLSYVNYEDKRTITKRFTIEYCDDEGKLERIDLLPEYGGLEIDDVYHAVYYNEVATKTVRESFDGIVMETYIRMLFNSKICDVKLYEEIYDGDELIQERWFEFPSTFCHEMARVIAKDVTESRDNLRKQIEPLTKELEEYKEFLKEMNAENAYKEWKDKRRA